MNPELREQYFLSNQMARIYLEAVNEVIGRYGLQALLRMAHLGHWIETPPPATPDLVVDYCDFAALNTTLGELYGPHGGRTLALRAGRASFRQTVMETNKGLYLTPDALVAMPLHSRVPYLLESVVKRLTREFGSHIAVEEKWEEYHFSIAPCPLCYGRTHSADSVCHSFVGFLQQAVEWARISDYYHVQEVSCAATQHEDASACVFALLKL